MEKNQVNSIVTEQTMEIVITFNEQGKILFSNRCAREKLGYSEEEFLECNMTWIFWREFRQDNGTFDSFDIAKIIDVEETIVYRKNSTCFPISLRFFPVINGCYCLLAEDITWRKNMDMRVRQLKEEEKMNKQVRNEFTANVTHELRTPVNGIRGHVTTLLEVVTDEQQRRTLEIIIYCCNNMSAIINNILDFSKMEAGKFSIEVAEFDFYNMMDQVIATHMAEINKKELQINIYIDKNIPQSVIGDSLRISQILNNLLSNAIKFTLMGGISIDVSKTSQINDQIELFFMVRDTGIGISKDEQDKLFQSFKQADASITRRFGGTGLGLSITKQLVEMMGGTIHVESEKGNGSCFSFNIKLRVNQAVEESKDLSEVFKRWANITTNKENDGKEQFFEFGTTNNKAELKKRMEKLILSIELGSWEKAENLGETIKALTEKADSDVKRAVLRLGMAIRKENYEKSIEAYENVKRILSDMLEES
ncbi:MAG: PAS domain-containing protein [Lachnospira sp.]|nr:PAS domain-containing protein [Lachnospira sp.]